MEWTRYQDQSGFNFEYPVGWNVETTQFPSCTVSSPDKLWFALIQPMLPWPGVTPADIINKGQFPTANLFPAAKIVAMTPHGTEGAEATLSYRAGDGSVGRAVMVCANYGKMLLLCAVAAPEAAMPAAEPILMRIVRTQNLGMQTATPAPAQVPGPSTPAPAAAPAAPPPLPGLAAIPAMAVLGGAPPVLPPTIPSPPAPPAALPLSFVRFTDPQRGSFTTEVPVGWRVTGGLNHPGVGDCRPWFQASSPDGIYIFMDPEFPISLCHFWLSGKGGKMAAVGAGGALLNLKPGAENSADCFIKQSAKTRFPGFTQVRRIQRPDIAEVVRQQIASQGVKIGRKGHTQAIETILERKVPAGTIVASVLTTSIFTGSYGIGVAFWNSMNISYVAPASLTAKAEQARTHMATTILYTPAMYQIAKQDEAQIYANAQAQNAAQWNWFNQQQAQHRAQLAQGDAIMNNYWATQRANDQIVKGWEQNQAVYDRLSQQTSDTMLGNQRLFDASAGLQIDAPAGSNYYWRNPSTGQVIGTETNQPPDYQNNYTELKKL